MIGLEQNQQRRKSRMTNNLKKLFEPAIQFIRSAVFFIVIRLTREVYARLNEFLIQGNRLSFHMPLKPVESCCRCGFVFIHVFSLKHFKTLRTS
jgi:hypothetical protein